MSRSGTDSSTLVIFCRRPAPGIGKQRIAADLGTRAAEALANRLLATVLEDAEAWPGPVVLSPACVEDRAWAETLLGRSCRVIAQPEGNLGNRINSVDRAIRSRDDEVLLFIGSDAPVLDQDYFARARSLSGTADVVLGPADDGGVTLMGSRTAWPDLSGLPWSTAGLAGTLERMCVESGHTVKRLPRMYDIDLASDLPRLHADLEADARPARQQLHRWLDGLLRDKPE